MRSGLRSVFTCTLIFTAFAVVSPAACAIPNGVIAESPLPNSLPPSQARSAVSPDAIDACLREAASHHRVDVRLLRAIAVVESGLNPAALNRANTNGSRDIGLMQINSSWLPRLARLRIFERDLFDPCVSAYVGAWILADNIARYGPVWRAVGAYNARTPARQLAYVRRVQRQLSAVSAKEK